MALLAQLGRVMVRQGRAANSVAVALICDQFSGQIEDVKAPTPMTAGQRRDRAALADEISPRSPSDSSARLVA